MLVEGTVEVHSKSRGKQETRTGRTLEQETPLPVRSEGGGFGLVSIKRVLEQESKL